MNSIEEERSEKTLPAYERRYDIDWLRIFAVFMVFIFHCARFFDINDWHVKDSDTSVGITVFINFLGGVGMPLFL